MALGSRHHVTKKYCFMSLHLPDIFYVTIGIHRGSSYVIHHSWYFSFRMCLIMISSLPICRFALVYLQFLQTTYVSYLQRIISYNRNGVQTDKVNSAISFSGLQPRHYVICCVNVGILLHSTDIFSSNHLLPKGINYSNRIEVPCQYEHHSLQWRHNERDGVPNHHPHDLLFNRLFRRRAKLRVISLYEVNSRWPRTIGQLPGKMFLFDDVIMHCNSVFTTGVKYMDRPVNHFPKSLQ